MPGLLSGNYQQDLPLIEQAVSLAHAASEAARTGGTRTVGLTPSIGRLNLDCVIVPFRAGATSVTFDVPHNLGRVPKYFIAVMSPVFLQPMDVDKWTSTNVRFSIGFLDATGYILLA